MSTGPTPLTGEANGLYHKLMESGKLGETTDGAAWCLKALHPAEPTINGTAVPDGTTCSTLRSHYSWSHTISSPDPARGLWGIDSSLVPHPVAAFEYTPTFEDGTVGSPAQLNNPTFTPSTVPVDNLGAAFMSQFERWRLTFMSVTIHLDANATKDSGTVVASQQATQPFVLFPGSSASYVHPPIAVFQDEDQPDYDKIMSFPKAYQSNAKFGLYMPLRLTNTSQHWRSVKELIGVCSLATTSYHWGNEGTQIIPSQLNPGYPLWAITPTHFDMPTSQIRGASWPGFLNDIFGHICFKGLDPSASLVLKFRVGLEQQVQYGATTVSYVKPPPEVDNHALMAYARLSVSLPDAFPASANDNGTVLKWIGEGMKKIAPAVKFIPGYGSLAAPVVDGLGSLALYGAKSLAKRQGIKNPYKKQRTPQQKSARRAKKAARRALGATPAHVVPVATTATTAPVVVAAKPMPTFSLVKRT